MLTKATVKGLVVVEEAPIANHYHEGKVFNSVTVLSYRGDKNSKVDHLRLYFEQGKFDTALFTVGNYIKYTGDLVKSKITESLSDIAVSLETVAIVTPEELKENEELNLHLATGSVLDMTGTIIKISPETVSKDITSISILVMTENADGRRVIAKLTGVGRMAEIIKTLNKDDVVNVYAKVFSYPTKNRTDGASYYLHDSRIASIIKVSGEVND